jgi:hypothetical protein
MDIQEILADIDTDPSLTPRQRLKAKADATRDYRSLYGRPERTYGRADRTSPGRAFSTSAARSLGSGIVRGFLRALFGGR